MDKFMTVVNQNGIPFHVRLVEQGEKFGLERCLTHDNINPLVEFYDARYTKGFDLLGQFVSRYYLSTLLRIEERGGLCLNGEILDWYIDEEAMQEIYDWFDWITKYKISAIEK